MLEHISKNKRVVREKVYYKTDDPNIFIEQYTQQEEIHLNILNRLIEELDEKLNDDKYTPEDKINILKEKIEKENLKNIIIEK